MTKEVIAILCADIHLQHKAPIWRSAEPDWYKAMRRPLNELSKVQYKYNQCPILCAGDIFDRWDSCPELINFALGSLPINIRSIPGQHDLPNHRYEDIHRSAYETLVRSKTIMDMTPTLPIWLSPKLCVTGFPFGMPIEPCLPRGKDKADIEVALIHEYAWVGRHKYPNAPRSAKVGSAQDKIIDGKLYGYDVIVYGDNHKGFMVKVGKTTVFNCGTLMRRHADEKEYDPQIGLLYSDGSVKQAYLDISQDKYIPKADMPKVMESTFDMAALATELQKLGHDDRDFKKLLKEYLRSIKVRKAVRVILREAVESNE